MHGGPPRCFGWAAIEQDLEIGDGFRALPVLLLGDGQPEARDGIGTIHRTQGFERGARLGVNEALSHRERGLDQPPQTRRVGTEQANGTAPGIERIGRAAHAGIDGRQHLPAAPIVRAQPQLLLDTGDKDFDLSFLGRGGTARAQGLVGKMGRAEGRIGENGDGWEADGGCAEDGAWRGRRGGSGGCGAIRLLEQAALDFEPGGFCLCFVDQTALEIGVDLGKLVLVDGDQGRLLGRLRPRQRAARAAARPRPWRRS